MAGREKGTEIIIQQRDVRGNRGEREKELNQSHGQRGICSSRGTGNVNNTLTHEDSSCQEEELEQGARIQRKGMGGEILLLCKGGGDVQKGEKAKERLLFLVCLSVNKG